VEAVAIGDIHFDGPFQKLVQEGHNVICQEIQNILDWATKRGINTIFFYGDICDHPRMSYESFRAFTKLLHVNNHLKFHILLGNHDKFSVESSAGHSLEVLCDLIGMGSLPHVTVYIKPTDIEIDGVGVRMLPWPSRAFSKSRLNIAHIEVAGSKSDSGREMDPEGLYSGSAVIAAGHLHTNQVVRSTYFSGTPFQQNFGESPKKYFHHIKFNSVKDYEIDSVPHTPKYILHSIVLESKEDVNKIPTAATDLVKLIIKDGATVDMSKLNYPNVVKTTGYRNKEELKQVMSDDLSTSESLTIDTTEFFKAWLDLQGFDTEKSKAVLELRRELLRT
jgi:DNA repair exonuclease SbcCD nuclease subunit